jgi:hypothetical protein
MYPKYLYIITPNAVFKKIHQLLQHFLADGVNGNLHTFMKRQMFSFFCLRLIVVLNHHWNRIMSTSHANNIIREKKLNLLHFEIFFVI